MADPASVLQQNAEINSGETARLSSFVGAIALGDLVKTTLGPRGMDKILQSVSDQTGKVNVTNDGATILRSIHIDNPAAKILVDMSKTQDDVIGDGTTSVVVLASSILKECEKLIAQNIHPMTIIEGIRKASDAARKALLESSSTPSKEQLKENLIKIANTTLSSKLLNKDKAKFSNLAVDAILRLDGETDLSLVQILKLEGGSLEQSFLDHGFLLQKKIGVNQPKVIKNAKILVANTPMDTDKIKIYGAKVNVDSLTKVSEIEEQEKKKMKEKVEKIAQHGINVFLNRQLIYNFPEQLFADKGIMAIEHCDFDGIERIAHVTGAELVSTFDHPNECVLGSCEEIREVMVGEQKLIQFKGLLKGNACTVVLRGASKHVLDEAERSLHDALAVLSQVVAVDQRIVLGGGCSETKMAAAVENLLKEGKTLQGKEVLAAEAFATALRSLPSTLAENGGYDSAELVAQLRQNHLQDSESTMGIDMDEGKLGCMKEKGVVESFKLKQHVLMSASEAAEAILRVDYIIRAAPRQRTEE